MYQEITDYLGIEDQIKICNLNKNCYENIKIYKLSDYRINEQVLLQNKFNNLIELNIFANYEIKNISHLVHLEKLVCSLFTKITDENIINLTKLKNIITIYTREYRINKISDIKKIRL